MPAARFPAAGVRRARLAFPPRDVGRRFVEGVVLLGVARPAAGGLIVVETGGERTVASLLPSATTPATATATAAPAAASFATIVVAAAGFRSTFRPLASRAERFGRSGIRGTKLVSRLNAGLAPGLRSRLSSAGRGVVCRPLGTRRQWLLAGWLLLPCGRL